MGFKQRFYQLVGGSFVALTMVTSSALAEELDNWSFDTATNELTFSLSDAVLPEFFLLAEPPRLVLDIPDTQIGAVEPEQIYSGAVQTIRVAQHTPDQVRVVIELAPDSVLSPDQADIQFDDNNGQRHWRFRPLLADDTVIADESATAEPTAAMNEPDISLSAANLELPTASAGSILPIDPYANASSDQPVSVPPLADISESADANSAAEPAAVTPDLPPMTVPVLEVTELDGSLASSEAAEAAITNVRASVLPDLADGNAESAAEPPVETTVEPTLSTAPQDGVSAAVVPEGVPTQAAETPADTAVTVTTTATATPDVSVPVPDEAASAEPSADVVPNVLPVAVPTTETALVPVQRSAESQSVTEENRPGWQTIQQPAADRTILQTDTPAPLTFGQPLPSQAR